MTAKMYADPQIKKARKGIIPLSRIGDPADIANVIEFLVGPLSGYVRGRISVSTAASPSLFLAIFLVDQAPTIKARCAWSRVQR